MPETVRDSKMVELLNEAYGNEQQLTAALELHLQATTRPDYKKRLTDHLKETKAHARAVSKRIKQLGGTPAQVSLPGPEGVSKAAQGMQDTLAKAKAARASCDNLVSKACNDLPKGSTTCKMVQERTESRPRTA